MAVFFCHDMYAKINFIRTRLNLRVLMPDEKSEKRWQFLLPCLVEGKEIADGQSKQWEASEVCLRIFVIKEEQRCLSDLP